MPSAEVARAFGLGTATRELTHVARGAMGVVYRLDTTDGPVGVKRLFWGPEGNEEANAAFQFAAADAGVPLARPLLTNTGEVVAELEGEYWRAFEWIDDIRGNDCVGVEVARALGRLHSLRYDMGSVVDEWYTAQLGAARVNHAVDVAAKHGVEIELRRNDLLRLDEVVAAAPAEPVVACHRDVESQNVLVDVRGPVLIDWDNAGPAVPAREFAVALENFEHEVAPMVHAYREAGGEFAPTDVSVFAMRFATDLHFFVMCAEHLELDDMTEEQLAFERPFLEYFGTAAVRFERYEQILEMVPA
jgi:Ser/Thr protein kinase RdoA (MazF antagonist)